MSGVRVGLGTTMIEPGLTGGKLDGIGVYTQALLRHLPLAGVGVTGYSYPPLRGRASKHGSSSGTGSSSAAASSSAIASDPEPDANAASVPAPGAISAGRAMPQSFERATLIDLLTPRVHRVHMPADLFHAPDYRVIRMDCPVVATLHDALPIKYPEWCNPRLRRLKNWMQVTAARKADHVIAVSHFAVPELVECFGVDERRISVVPNGVDIDWLEAPDPEQVAATLTAHGLAPGYFLFVGTLQPRKNVERLLEAYLGLPAEVRRARQLVIVGNAGWRCEELVRQIEAAVQNGERVVWLNGVTGEETLRHLYAGAGVFVFPSLYEGFGIPVVEAFASNVPVVTSNVSSLPEVSQGAAVEVDPTSAGEIGAAMLDMVTDDLLRRRCIAAGRRRAEQLTWQATALRTAAVYHAVLST